MGWGGGFCSGLCIWKSEQGLGFPAGQRAGRPEMAVGGEGGPPKGPLFGCGIWAWEIRLGGLGPGSSQLPAWVPK